ncbi:hypothetical protein HU200_048728 [Digitaria exilis]|uniref:Uncharacterized protein n=1 Tax=Digitaria exilis TaxID=1010633 RepID=A0A835EAB6_9POAL|nr:hypothetical protein HU200_048728 [Digitaria exilis]
MAEIVSSALTQEAVHQVLDKLKERYEHNSDAKDRMKRMEMAHIRLEAALEASCQWGVASAPLLRWRSKLKRAAQECDHTMRRCRQRLQEEKEEKRRRAAAGGSSLLTRVSRAATSFISSISGSGDDDDEPGASTVRRFEWFAEGASEFLRFVELGGSAPRRFMFFDGALVRHLLGGKGTKCCFVHGGQHLLFVLQPFSPPERERERGRGMEATLVFLLEDGDVPENNFLPVFSLRLSESTDIVGAVVRYLELFTPHLMRSTAEAVKTKLTQLPKQDLRWVSDAQSVYGCDEHRDSLHSIFSKWVRPNPLCCHQHENKYSTQKYGASSSSELSEPLTSNIHLEPVTQVYLLGHTTLSAEIGNNRRQRVVVDGEARDFLFLKIGVQFWPHASSEDLLPAVRGSMTETINGEATQRGLCANMSFQQLREIMLPKAVDCLRKHVAATSYQALWKSKHGRAYLQVEKTPWRSAAPINEGARQGKKIKAWKSGISEFISSWIVHTPAELQASAVNWMQKQRRSPLPLILKRKTTACIHDCPFRPLSLQDFRSLARKIKSRSAFHALRA